MGRGNLRPRRHDKRDDKRTVLLVTNGQRTEMTYLSWVRQSVNRKRRDIRITVAFMPGDPGRVLRKLKSPHGDTDGYDEVWIIVDEDGTDRSDWVRQVNRLSTRSQQWRAVVSRPCFEAWLVAHYEQVRNYADQSDARRHYRELVTTGLPPKELPADFPYASMQQAVERCRLAGTQGEAQPAAAGLPPSPGSAMPQLLHALGLVELPAAR